MEDRGWRRGCRHRGELRGQVEERVAVDVAYTAADAVAIATRGDAREGEMRSQQVGLICLVEVFTADGGVVKVVATRLAVRHAHDAEGLAAAAAHGALAAEAQRELGRAAVEAAGPQRPGRSMIEVTRIIIIVLVESLPFLVLHDSFEWSRSKTIILSSTTPIISRGCE
jgi:F0F1-type ATP synthase membrane subunit c/vacuolar-type H+-ATPase subunit K